MFTIHLAKCVGYAQIRFEGSTDTFTLPGSTRLEPPPGGFSPGDILKDPLETDDDTAWVVFHKGDLAFWTMSPSNDHVAEFLRSMGCHKPLPVGIYRGTRNATVDGGWTAIAKTTAKAGVRGTAIVEGNGSAYSGEEGQSISGDGGMSFTKQGGLAISGHRGESHTGKGGVAITGDKGIAVAGNGGVAIAGAGGYASVGTLGSAVSGGTISGGELSALRISHEGRVYDATVGAKGILPHTVYRIRDGEWEVAPAKFHREPNPV